MLQTYILRADVAPLEAVKTGADASICGDCPARGATGDGKGRTCYVNLGQGPRAVWSAWKAGNYPKATLLEQWKLAGDRKVRLGTYGDPAAVPAIVWARLVSSASGHTGYTHQWRVAPELRTLCMASCDSLEEANEARERGWRTFRVAFDSEREPRQSFESVCPASAEAGKKLTCAECLACDGARGRRGSIVINPHGGTAVMANIRKRVAA